MDATLARRYSTRRRAIVEALCTKLEQRNTKTKKSFMTTISKIMD